MLLDLPVDDRRVIYVARGGETVFYADWRVDTGQALVVRRERAGGLAVLDPAFDYNLEQLGRARGCQVRLAAAALAGDVYEIEAAPGYGGLGAYAAWVSDPGAVGTLAASLARGPIGRIDYAHAVDVTLTSGEAPSTVTLAALLDGANLAAVQNGAGEWEVFAFRVAAPLGGLAWRLTELLRGLEDTASAMRDPLAAGAPVVFRRQS